MRNNTASCFSCSTSCLYHPNHRDSKAEQPLGFQQALGGGVVFLNARNFSTCPWMRILFITEIIVSFWGVRLVDIPSIKSRRVQILGNSPCYKSTSLESSV